MTKRTRISTSAEGRTFTAELYGPVSNERYLHERALLQYRVRNMPVWERNDQYGEPKDRAYYGWPDEDEL